MKRPEKYDIVCGDNYSALHPLSWRHLDCFHPIPNLRLDATVVQFIVRTQEKHQEAALYCERHNQRLTAMLPRAPGQEFARRLATDAHVSRAVLEPLKFLSAADLASVALAGKAWHAASWSPELWADFAQPRSALHPKLWFVFRTLSACCSCRATPASHQVAAVLTPHRVLCTACAPRVCPLLPISFLRKNCPVLLSTSTLPRIVYENTEYTYKSMAERAVRECRQDRMQTAIEVLTELSVLKSGEQLKLMDLGLFRLTVRSAGQFDQFLVDYLLGVEQCGRKKLKRHVAKHYGLTH